MQRPQEARSQAGLTFPEAVTALLITSVLIVLFFPFRQGCGPNSEKLAALNMTHQIAVATNAYLVEYGELPPLKSFDAAGANGVADEWAGDPAMGASVHNNALFFTLRAIPKGPNQNHAANKKRVRFFDARTASISAGVPKEGFFDKDRKGTPPSPELEGNLYDPWGREYGVILDRNNNGRLDLDGIYLDKRAAPEKQVGAFSTGKDGALGKNGDRMLRNGDERSDDVVSWE